MAYSAIIREQCRQLISDKTAVLKESDGGRPDILSVLLRSQDMSGKSIQYQMLTFLAAGRETTSSASALAVFLLATHPDIQGQLKTEVRDTLSKYSLEELSLQVLDSMPYLSAVATEALRLWPRVPFTARVAIRKTSIAGLIIPPGSIVQISHITVHHLDSIWGPHVLDFKPQRCLNSGEKTPGGSTHPLAYMPFLHGPRACIGQTFAMAKIRCLIASFVERFRFEMLESDEKVSIAGVVSGSFRCGCLNLSANFHALSSRSSPQHFT